MAQLTSEIESRFALYVEELQACAQSRGIAFGSPADLPVFLQQVTQPGRLRSEISSLVRATIFREQEEITPEQMVELLTFSIGGPTAASEPGSAAVQQQLRMLVGEIFRGLWPHFSDSTPAPSSPPPTPVHLDPSSTSARAQLSAYREEILLHTETEPVAKAPIQPTDEPERPMPPAASHSTRRAIPHLQLDLHHAVEPEAKWFNAERVERRSVAADLDLQRNEDLFQDLPQGNKGQNPFQAVRSLWRDPEAEVTEEGEYPQYSALELANPERRRYIALGVGGLLIGAALGTFIWRVPAAAPVPPTPRSVLQSPSTEQTTPSAVPASPALAPEALPAGNLASPSLDRSRMASPSRAHRVTNRDWDRALGIGNSSYSGRDSQPSETTATARQEARPAAAASPEPLASDADDATTSSDPSVPPSASLTAKSQPRVLVNGGSIYLSVAGPMAANLLSAPVPQYPATARAAGVQGAVTVQAVVGLQGDVVATRVLSGPPLLRGAAQAAVHRWRFVPYLVGGRPSMFTTEALVDFRSAR